MASISNEIVLKTIEYRPCKVDGKKALFHRWTDFANTVGASPMIGGAPGGQIKYTLGIVEFEDGKVQEISPHKIAFCDSKIQEYYFKGE